MLRVFLFPQSAYLDTRWWHRLAKVLAVVWAVVVIWYVYNDFVIRPFDKCVYDKANFERVGLDVSFMDCHSSSLSHLLAGLHTSRGIADFVFGLVGTYIALCLLGLLYRVILYIAKGKTGEPQRRNRGLRVRTRDEVAAVPAVGMARTVLVAPIGDRGVLGVGSVLGVPAVGLLRL